MILPLHRIDCTVGHGTVLTDTSEILVGKYGVRIVKIETNRQKMGNAELGRIKLRVFGKGRSTYEV